MLLNREPFGVEHGRLGLQGCGLRLGGDQVRHVRHELEGVGDEVAVTPEEELVVEGGVAVDVGDGHVLADRDGVNAWGGWNFGELAVCVLVDYEVGPDVLQDAEDNVVLRGRGGLKRLGVGGFEEALGVAATSEPSCKGG